MIQNIGENGHKLYANIMPFCIRDLEGVLELIPCEYQRTNVLLQQSGVRHMELRKKCNGCQRVTDHFIFNRGKSKFLSLGSIFISSNFQTLTYKFYVMAKLGYFSLTELPFCLYDLSFASRHDSCPTSSAKSSFTPHLSIPLIQ